MPVVIVKTALPQKIYEKFKQKAVELNMSEYELAQTILRGAVANPDGAKIILVFKQAMKEFEEIMSCEHCP